MTTILWNKYTLMNCIFEKIKTINLIATVLLSMVLMSCIPDKATYTNVEESIFITTERIWIRDFCNVENGMSVSKFYNGLED